MTQQQIYEQTGIAPGYVSHVENARANPTLAMIEKLAQAVGLEAWAMIRPDTESGIACEKPARDDL